MIEIKSENALPYIQADINAGYLTEQEPLLFISGNFTYSLTKPQFEKLKKFAVKKEDKPQNKEQEKAGGKEPTGLEILKGKYDALKDKKSPEAANLRKQIKELEEQEKKGGK